MSKRKIQSLKSFHLPDGFRGRSAIFVQIWWIVQATLIPLLPQVAYPIRRTILRLFGAKIGDGVRIRPGVQITYPWKVSIGDNSWIGDNVTLYSLGPISIGADTVISQESYLCAADHDYTDPCFPIRERPVVIGNEVWIAGGVWIGPGVTIESGTVVGARSTVVHDLPTGMVCVGSPCRPIKRRTVAEDEQT